MNWLNLETRMLRSPEFIGSEPQERATWLCLLAYCAEQENGGTIADCGTWKDRRWQQTCGITIDEVAEACELWTWKDNALTVWGYPTEKENEVRLMREFGKIKSDKKANAAKANGSKGGRPQNNPTEKPTPLGFKPNEENPTEPTPLGLKPIERKGKEEKRIEENSLSAGASESTGFADEVPTAAVGGMEAIAGKICGLREDWSRIALTYSERQSIIQNAGALHSVSESDWRAIHGYLRAKIPEGRPAWQPRSRAKFIETVGDVLNYALEWQRRSAPAAPLKLLPAVRVISEEERKETMQEFAQVFGKGGR